MIKHAIIVLGVWFWIVAAAAQPTPYTLETEGTATVETVPDYVEFWLHFKVVGPNLKESAAGAKGIEAKVRKEIEALELKPLEIAVTGVAIPSLQTIEARLSARLRFGTAEFGQSEEGSSLFGSLCDKIRTLSEAVGATAEGPVVGVSEKKPIEQSAVQKAIENAYPTAEAAAQILRVQIVAVERVRISSLKWNVDPENRAMQPELRHATCTAVVMVFYTFSAG
ncbi:MAG: SIMPL domain-containing protein [Candidatus Hydrogenedentes bacterium]|nr:SIMPL domain-containing protein [Candidatus Hydrogenedentota bacterium]